jgi:hypothetical protein
MPKASPKKRNGASSAKPYGLPAAKTKAANSIFKMNTDLGQHVLKNPGVAQKIVDKAGLKQSDVCTMILFHYLLLHVRTLSPLILCSIPIDSIGNRSWFRKSHSQDSRKGEKGHRGGIGPPDGGRSHETSTRQARAETFGRGIRGRHQTGFSIF